MAARFNPPPNWPAPPVGWVPPEGWSPDPSWGPPPPGWQLWVEESHGGPSAALPAGGPSPATHGSPSWLARHKAAVGLGAVVVVLVAVGALSAGRGAGDAPAAAPSATHAAAATATPAEDVVAEDEADAAADAEAEERAKAEEQAKAEAEAAAKAEEERLAEEQRAAEEAAAAEATAAEAARVGTVAQQNAYRSAVSYLDYTAFSRTGLLAQLVFEGFADGDAEFAVARLEGEGGVDWNAQAAASAANYLQFSPFSRAGLIDQLEFEGFTPEQAEYGVSTTGL